MTMRAIATSKIVTPVFAAATLLLSLVLIPAKSAVQPNPLYATAGAGTNLVAFNLEAKITKTIGSMGYPPSLALAFCPPGGLVPYTITNLFTSSPQLTQLATLNLDTGAATLVGSGPPPDLPNDIMGMTCSRNGTLYAVGQSDFTQPDTYNSLYVIDRVSGQPTRIGSLGVNDNTGDDFLMSLAFAPNGELYGANVFSLFKIDPKTGFATKVIDFSSNVAGNVMGLAIDSGGNFYVADFVLASQIYAVDTTTGVATSILKTGLMYVHNIAFRVPF
jgi:hypothetical protein